MRFGLQYDLRNPPQWRRPSQQLYAEFLDQLGWADAHGFDFVSFPEHHFTDDWYMSSPIAVGAAAAARSRRMRIEFSLMLLPLHNPVQVAEDLAAIDIISNGRLDVQFGTGYRPPEYEGYGIDMKSRPGRMDEAIEIIKKCWTEDEFSFEGRYWQLKNVRMTPKPVQKPRPSIVLGGASPASARRAARVADGYNPLVHRMYLAWREEMLKLGKDPGREKTPDLPKGPANFLWVARDPRKAWKEVGPYAQQVSNSYADYAGGLRYAVHKKSTDPDELLADGSHRVMTPEEVVALAQEMEKAAPEYANLRVAPLYGGMPAELGQECLELIASEVLPKLKPASKQPEPIMSDMRPIPVPTPDTQPYWDAARQNRLAIQRCGNCRRWHHPPEAACPACGAETLAFETVSGKGRIYTYSVMYDKRVRGFENRVPYIAVWVELPEQPGLLVIGNLLEAGEDEVKIGLPVAVVFEKLNDEFTLPQFKLVK